MSIVERPTERQRGVRNITVTATLDRERYDALEDMSRGLGITRSTAVCRLLDLHAGEMLDAIMARPEVRFVPERARARRLTGELIVDIASLVREGMTKADAYRRVGVNAKTAASWERRGREDHDADRTGLHADFVSGLDQARAEFNFELVQEARRRGDYKVLLKLLDPEQFALPTRSEVDVTHRFQMLLDWDLLSLRESKLLAWLLRKASPQEDHPAVNRSSRPAAEAIPQELLDVIDAEDGDWSEAPGIEAPKPDA